MEAGGRATVAISEGNRPQMKRKIQRLCVVSKGDVFLFVQFLRFLHLSMETQQEKHLY